MITMTGRAKAVIERAMRSFLTDRCDIYAATGATTDYGAPLGTSSVLASRVPCRIISAGSITTPQSDVYGAQESITERYRLIVPAKSAEYDFDFEADQEIVINNARFQIATILQRHSDAPDRQCIIVRMS